MCRSIILGIVLALLPLLPLQQPAGLVALCKVLRMLLRGCA